MKAAVLNQIPGDLEIVDTHVDKPEPHEVLIRTVAAGLCHSDLHVLEGKLPGMTPLVMGHESAGVVEAVGEDVSYVKPGDHVITCLSVFCGHCEQCLSGRPSICLQSGMECTRPHDAAPRLSVDGTPAYQFTNLGSFAEEMLIHEHGLVKIREDMPLDRAAVIGCGITTGTGAVFRTARVRPGSTVAVIGAGGVGLAAIQGARIAGANRIIAVDMLTPKLEIAKELGATHTVDASAGDPVAQVLELTSGGVDYSFEAIGLKKTAEQAFGMLRSGGTATVIGVISPGVNVEIPGMQFLMEKKLQGSMMGSNQFRTDMPRLVDMYMDGRLKLDEMLSAHLTLDQINDGFAAMKRGEGARQVVDFN